MTAAGMPVMMNCGGMMMCLTLVPITN